MAETFKEREKPKEKLLPAISRGEELHSSIDTLGRSASHIRLTSESAVVGPNAMPKADLNMAIAKNVSELRLEGSAPIHKRFQNMLASLR